jgi:hypothetical protein
MSLLMLEHSNMSNSIDVSSFSFSRAHKFLIHKLSRQIISSDLLIDMASDEIIA